MIRDVSRSYRLAIKETVYHFVGYKPTTNEIDVLKAEGTWNNDWDASMELIKRHKKKEALDKELPIQSELVRVFSNFYFGGDPDGNSKDWKGYICNEPLLIKNNFFNSLTQKGFSWGFLSGAERPSAKFILEDRLGLKDPPLIAMEDAPSKPDPTGLLRIAQSLLKQELGKEAPVIAYLGDTVADVLTVKNAQKRMPNQLFKSLAVAPPHLHGESKKEERKAYERQLKCAGTDIILSCTEDLIQYSEFIS